eukprot:1807495-Amphidinium_carterae.1
MSLNRNVKKLLAGKLRIFIMRVKVVLDISKVPLPIRQSQMLLRCCRKWLLTNSATIRISDVLVVIHTIRVG